MDNTNSSKNLHSSTLIGLHIYSDVYTSSNSLSIWMQCLYFEFKHLIHIRIKIIQRCGIFMLNSWNIVTTSIIFQRETCVFGLLIICIQLSFSMLYLIYIFFGRETKWQVVKNSHTQSGGTRVRTSVMVSDLAILSFLLVELGFVDIIWFVLECDFCGSEYPAYLYIYKYKINLIMLELVLFI
jgi:hypothetical protein